jgi:hypothetical protein
MILTNNTIFPIHCEGNIKYIYKATNIRIVSHCYFISPHFIRLTYPASPGYCVSVSHYPRVRITTERVPKRKSTNN